MLPSKSVTIFCKLGVTALKKLDRLPIDSKLRAEIAAEIEKIPNFSTFTGHCGNSKRSQPEERSAVIDRGQKRFRSDAMSISFSV
jgi:hypothetical protein